MAVANSDDEAMSDWVDYVIVSMYDGDLAPMAEFIRAMKSIDGKLALQIADAIDGLGPVKLVTMKTGGDRRSWVDRWFEISLQIEKGAFAYKRLHEDPGLNFDTVCEDVAKHFRNQGEKASRTSVAAALAKFRRYVDDRTVAFGDLSTWWLFTEQLDQALAETNVSPNPKRRVRRSKLVK